jgi:hypothetical protein
MTMMTATSSNTVMNRQEDTAIQEESLLLCLGIIVLVARFILS